MDKIEGLGTTNKVGGSGAESSQPKLPDMPDLDVPEVPSAQAPDLPDLPDLPPVPNIPDARFWTGRDAEDFGHDIFKNCSPASSITTSVHYRLQVILQVVLCLLVPRLLL